MNGDDLATLDEALAFIAFCDEGSHAADSITTSSAKVQDIQNPFTLEDIDHLLILSTKTQPPKHAFSSTELQSAPARKKKRVRSAASSSTVIQRRRKVELETLREETVKLEAYLTHLSTTQGQQKPLALTKDCEILSEWHRHAFVQYQQRHKSEQTNRKLKVMIEKQLKLSKKLQGVLFKRKDM